MSLAKLKYWNCSFFGRRPINNWHEAGASHPQRNDQEPNYAEVKC